MPGQDLFEYVDDDGTVRCIGSADVNAYLRELAGEDVTAKDFRTWHATSHALALLKAAPIPGEAAIPRRTANEILAEVAARLGNTVAVCRKAYVHPGVLELAAGGLPDECVALPSTAPRPRTGLSRGEADLMAFLENAATRARRARRATPRENATSQRSARA
jgi:DNA topoisomerase-1